MSKDLGLWLQKNWKGLTLLGSALIGCLTWLILLDQKSFDDVPQKVKILDHVEAAPSPRELWQKYYNDSIDTANRIESRNRRDSAMKAMLLEMKEIRIRQAYEDSIDILNADQIYQMKQLINDIQQKVNNN